MNSEEQAVLFKVSSVAIKSSLGMGRREAQAKAGYRFGCRMDTDWASQDWQYHWQSLLRRQKTNQIAWLTCELSKTSMLDVYVLFVIYGLCASFVLGNCLLI